ncbi:12032_t:CDS:2 [Racocetra persica]|uniref:12032_t:CDS:1 n=1 Tax=Racocetra persica TaxID=160502 RepID=A0ACA9MFW8_9GLOM|nr:12032_t:CDS:2 [Racocetra persica]
MNTNSEVMNTNSEVMNTNSEVMKSISEVMKRNSEVMKSISEVMKRNSEVMNRLILDQSHETGFMTRARAYSFRIVNQEYFLNNLVPTASEEEVQDWFDKLMKALPNFSSNLSVVDTHTNIYLEGYKPDFSILLNEDAVNQVYIPMFVCTLLEVKKRKSPSSGLTDEYKGQLLDYIQVLIQQQLLRVHFAIFLSDGFNFYVMDYDRDTKQYSEFTTNILTGICLFWVLINDKSPFISLVGPRSINFRTQSEYIRIYLKGYLGKGASSTVYEIDFKNISSAIKILETGYTLNNEVCALGFLNELHIQNVPTYVVHDNNSIIIRPVCKQIGNNFLVSHAQQLLRLLKRIHSYAIYHQDMRPENILLDTNNNKLVLADWGSAIRYFNNNGTVEYAGTILFSSPNILSNNFGSYIPKAFDDLYSFIRTIYILRNLSKRPTIPNGNLTLKAKVIREYWDDKVDIKLDGPFWIEMIDAATNENYDVLEKCCYVFKK